MRELTLASVGSKLGERTGYKPGSAGMEKGPFLPLNSILWQDQSSEKGPGRGLVQQVWSSEKMPVPFSDLQTLAGMEFGERTGPNLGFSRLGVPRKDRAKPWFGRFGLWRKDSAEP